MPTAGSAVRIQRLASQTDPVTGVDRVRKAG